MNRQIHPCIKIETKVIRIMRVTSLLCLLLQKKCIRKCLEEYRPSKRPTRPAELADEENDPLRPRPSHNMTLLVRIASLLCNHLISLLMHPKFPDLERRQCAKDLGARRLYHEFLSRLLYSGRKNTIFSYRDILDLL